MAVEFNLSTTVYLVLWILTVLTLCPLSYGAKLNAPQILLPFSRTAASNFTLKVILSPEEELAEPGHCYTWRSTHSDVVSVLTDDECSLQATVSAISKADHRVTSIIFAKDKLSNEVHHCYVIVDLISLITISTTTRLISLDDTPEILVVHAYDSEDNVFTTLSGMVFHWHFLSKGDKQLADEQNLKFLKFGESDYQTPPHIVPLEQQGKTGDTVLVESIKTGSAVVEARIMDTAYKNVAAATVVLTVIANLMINPTIIHVLQFGVVTYKLEQLRQNTITEIELPSPQYYLEVVNPKITSFDPATSEAEALQLGSTAIILRDRNIQDSEQSYQPSALMHVVQPAYIVFAVLPYKKWVLETDREYDIYLEIYDSDNHKIYPSENLLIEALFPEKYFRILHHTKNGSYFHVSPLQKGVTKIEGVLKGLLVKGEERLLERSLRTEQTVEIYDKIVVDPPSLLFPWDPNTKLAYSYKLTATGGSGEYSWYSQNLSIVNVNNKGLTSPLGPGIGTVRASDVKNHKHTGSAKIVVLPPTRMELLPARVEAEVNTILHLPVAMFVELDGREAAFADCRHLKFDVHFSDRTIFNLTSSNTKDSELAKGACSSLKIFARQPGCTKVTVSYQVYHTRLDASVTVAAYRPLVAQSPESVVALGSSRDLLFEGGPQPWQMDPSGYFETLSPVDSKFLAMTKLSGVEYSLHRGVHAFNIACTGLGQQTLTLTVGNRPTVTNMYPATAETKIKFICAEPVGIHLQPQVMTALRKPSLPPCPLLLDSNQVVPVHCNQNLGILLTVTDNQGRKFNNFTSLKFEWTLSDSSLATLDLHKPLEMTVDLTDSGNKGTAVGHQYVQMLGTPGTVIVTVSCSNYISKYLVAYGISLHSKLHTKVIQSLELNLVNEAYITPDTLSVFNHPSNIASLEIKKGSGYFYVEPIPDSVVDVVLNSHRGIIQVKPKLDGISTVIVHDLCLDVQQQPLAKVQVSGVGRIHLYVIDKVEVKKEVIAKVHILDVHAQPLMASFFRLMNVTLRAESDIVFIHPSLDKSDDPTVATYTVRGVQIGHTSLTCSALMESGEHVLSKTRRIEVFPPLHLNPRSITLIIGAFYQVLATGGPRPQGTVEFHMINSAKASVSSIGLLEALELGSTRVVGRAVGHHPDTNEPVVYSEDQVDVYVVKLSGVKIHSPLTRVKIGTRLPLYALGIMENVTPFSFGSSIPPLLFTWSVSNRKVATLQSVYHKSGVLLPKESNFGNQLVALGTGVLSVQLKVKPMVRGKKQVVMDKEFIDELQIEVFDELTLVSPSTKDGFILITPNTDIQLKTNLDGSVKLVYEINKRKGVASASISITPTGLLSAGSNTGQVTLTITSIETFGVNQTMVFNVMVKPASYLMLNANTVFKTSPGTLPALPLGVTFRLRVTLHDEIGRMFFASNIQTKSRCSRYDLLQITAAADNNSFIVKTTDVGQTILQVWNADNLKMSDYINIVVKKIIHPEIGKVKLGQTLCFHVPIVSDKGNRGSWSSATLAININSKTGIATAMGIGKTHINYNISTDLNTMTEVQVEAISKLIVENTTEFVSNVPNRNKEYLFPVRIEDGDSFIDDSCSALTMAPDILAPFNCFLEMSSRLQDIGVEDLFTVSMVYDSTSGNLACKLSQKESKILGLVGSTLVTDIILHVAIPALDNQPAVSAAPLSLPFYPAFHVHSSEIYLSTLSPQSSLRLSTVPLLFSHIQVTSSDPTLIEILPPESDMSTSLAMVYPVRLREVGVVWEQLRSDLSLDFSCQLTGQRVHVPIYIKLVERKEILPDAKNKDAAFADVASNQPFWFMVLLLTAAFFLVLALAYQVRYGAQRINPRPDVFLGGRYMDSASHSPVPTREEVHMNRYPEETPQPSSYWGTPVKSTSLPFQARRRTPTSNTKLWSVRIPSPEAHSTPSPPGEPPFRFT